MSVRAKAKDKSSRKWKYRWQLAVKNSGKWEVERVKYSRKLKVESGK